MNYIKYKKLMSKDIFLYIDTYDYLADDIFIRSKIFVKYINDSFLKTDKYKIILVKILKSDEEVFDSCMNLLNQRIIKKGYNDYNEICDFIINSIDVSKSKKRIKKM